MTSSRFAGGASPFARALPGQAVGPHVNRRAILRAAAAAGLLGAAPFGLGRMAFAATPQTRPILVVVHLRGGCDGLNLISPANDPDFIEARMAELRVAAEGGDAGYRLENGADPAIDFRLHKSAGALAEIYKDGKLAVIHAAGVPSANRSHFVATDIIDHGVGDAAALSRGTSGWLARHLHAIGATGLVDAVSATGGLAGEYQGDASSLALADLDGGFEPPGGPTSTAVLERLYAHAPGGVGAIGRATLAATDALASRLPRDAKGKPAPYANAAAYGKAGGLGRGLRTIAQLIRMDVGLIAASADCGGWDTHEYQPPRFRNQVDQLSSGLAAFWNDLAEYHDRLLVVTYTEFGRRLRSNKSQGTDHGRGGVMMVMGGRVAGGRFHGGWPGLATDRLDEHVDLAVKTDYRAVLSELLASHGGRPVAPEVFPGHAPGAPLGLIAA